MIHSDPIFKSIRPFQHRIDFYSGEVCLGGELWYGPRRAVLNGKR